MSKFLFSKKKKPKNTNKKPTTFVNYLHVCLKYQKAEQPGRVVSSLV